MLQNLTPGMQQYYDIKENYKDCLLFFRMGDFYEMFDDDAHIAHKILGIAITTRNKNATEPIPLAGIPFHAKEKYLPLLIKAGYKVAIAEQVSDPKLKGIVKREVVRVVTPSTLHLESEGYEGTGEVGNILLSLTRDKKGVYGMSVLHIASNKWFCSEFETLDLLKQQLYKIAPQEVILEKQIFSDVVITELLQKKYELSFFSCELSKTYEKDLLSHFGVKNFVGFGISDHPQAVAASALLLQYLQKNQHSNFDFLQNLSYESFSGFMDIDESTIRNLDLVYNIATKSSTVGTLFGVLNKTETSAGARFLRQQILHPLQDVEEIEKRQDMIQELIEKPILLDRVKKELSMIADVDMILNRLALNRALPRDVLALKKSLQAIVNIFNIIEKEGSQKLQNILLGSNLEG